MQEVFLVHLRQLLHDLQAHAAQLLGADVTETFIQELGKSFLVQFVDSAQELRLERREQIVVNTRTSDAVQV
jgi:hypothetical protein